jgi:tRNA acetyltransferase TAN1
LWWETLFQALVAVSGRNVGRGHRLLQDFNLLVSTSRGNERNTCSEMWYLLGEAGDRNPVVERTPVIGLVVARTKIDPVAAVDKLRSLLLERPWEFRYTLKVTPLAGTVSSDPQTIEDYAVKLAESIKREEKYRITVEKRRTSMSGRALIEAVAKRIDRKVDLETPDKVVLIQIIGEVTGVSVIPPDKILSVEREKRFVSQKRTNRRNVASA